MTVDHESSDLEPTDSGTEVSNTLESFEIETVLPSSPIPSEEQVQLSPTPPTMARLQVEAGSEGSSTESLKAQHGRISCDIPRPLLESARNAVVALSPTGLTLAGLVAAGVAAEVERLELAHNQGRPFAERSTSTLRRGRRIG